MPRSSSAVRKQAELAFDAQFVKPVASREWCITICSTLTR
jgi:hypothetical protein